MFSERILSSFLFISSSVTLPAAMPAWSSRGITGGSRIPWGESWSRSLIPCLILYFLRCSIGMVTWPFLVTLTICFAIPGSGCNDAAYHLKRSVHRHLPSCILTRALLAFSALSPGLLFDATKIDLPDKGLRDEVERVDLLLHQNISYLQRMLWKKLAVG